MGHPVQGGAIIAGIGQTEFSKNSGRSELQLAAEASRAAILDAGLTPDQIDGMVTFTIDTNDEIALARNLGVKGLKWWSETPWGGAGANSTIQHAAAAVTSGAADAVLVYRAFNERSGRRFGQPNAPRDGTLRPIDNYYTFGLDTPAKTYALWYQRYMHEFGVKNEDFGQYTVVARKHAATNPAAWFYQRPITIDDHQASRWIVEPILRKLDCCQESDGGVALVITRADRAEDLPNPAVRLAGISEAHFSHGHVMYNYYWDDIAEFPESKWAADQVYDRPASGPTTSTSSPSTRTSARWCSSSSRASASAARARPRTTSPTATSTSTASPAQPARRPARRGLHPRREQRARGHPPDPWHRGQPDQGRGARAVRDGRRRDHPHSGVKPGILTPA